MRTLLEMSAMQERLDSDRNALPHLRHIVASWRQRYENDQTSQITGAADRLMELNEYRRMGIGWAENNQEHNARFKQLRSNEQVDRQTVATRVSHLITTMERARHQDLAQTLHEYERFRSIPDQQKQLYRARREWARKIVDDTIEAIPYAPNQISDIANSGGQSYENLMHVLDDSYKLPADTETWIGQTAVVGEHFGAGACDEQSAYAFTEAHRRLSGTQVTLANVPPGHAMVIIGPPNCPESAHIDTWPLRPRVASPETYGISDIQEASVVYQAVADGRDLRDQALEYLTVPPPRSCGAHHFWPSPEPRAG